MDVSVQNQEVVGPAHQIAPGRRPYRRVLLKLGGEYLVGDARYGIDPRAPSAWPSFWPRQSMTQAWNSRL